MTVTYLLDTNTVSYIAKGNSPAARARLEALGLDESVCISSITEAELRYGLARRPAAQALRAAVEGLLLKLNILSWGAKRQPRMERFGQGWKLRDQPGTA